MCVFAIEGKSVLCVCDREKECVCRHVCDREREGAHRLVHLAQLGRDLLNALHGALRRQNAVLHRRPPQPQVREVLEQVRVDDRKLARRHAPRVDVRGVGLEAPGGGAQG